MTHMLDTDVLIYHLKGVDEANRLVSQLSESGLSISAITYMEVSDGLQNSRALLTEQPQFNRFVTSAPILDFGRQEARVAAQLRRDLRQQGRRFRTRALDVMIAATAVSHDLILVTNNPADYRDLPGLRFQDAGIHVQ